MKNVILLYSFILILVSFSVRAQTAESGFSGPEGKIEWVGQYPPVQNSKINFFEKVDRLLFGAKTKTVNTPVFALVNEQDVLYVLNQGSGTLSQIRENKSLELRNVNKEAFPSLVCACLMGDKGLLFTDSYLNRVFFLPKDEDIPVLFLTSDSLHQPTGIAYSEKTDEIWIVETSAHKITVFTSDGKFIRSVGGRGTEPGMFNFPTHIWIDEEGLVYLVDAMNFRIQILNSKGEYISSFGKQGSGSGSIARPKGIACDSHGNIYLADALFNTVQIFNKNGVFLYYFGDQGSGQEQFWMPSGIYIDKKDYIYVSDSYNNRIQIFKLLMGE